MLPIYHFSVQTSTHHFRSKQAEIITSIKNLVITNRITTDRHLIEVDDILYQTKHDQYSIFHQFKKDLARTNHIILLIKTLDLLALFFITFSLIQLFLLKLIPVLISLSIVFLVLKLNSFISQREVTRLLKSIATQTNAKPSQPIYPNIKTRLISPN